MTEACTTPQLNPTPTPPPTTPLIPARVAGARGRAPKRRMTHPGACGPRRRLASNSGPNPIRLKGRPIIKSRSLSRRLVRCWGSAGGSARLAATRRLPDPPREERRLRREPEWLGDAVLRDLVVRHVFAYCVCAGDGEPPAPAAQCAGLCDRCCSNETLARVWDHARAAHVAVCSSSKKRRKRLGRRERHASKWKADMVESALGALITDEKLSRAFSLDMIDVLLSSVLQRVGPVVRKRLPPTMMRALPPQSRHSGSASNILGGQLTFLETEHKSLRASTRRRTRQ